MSVSIQTSQNVLLEYEPASIGDRILATLIDYVIFLVWFMLVGWLSRYVIRINVMSSFFSLALFYLPIMFYDLLSEVFMNGQSLGKRTVNIRVVRLDGSQPNLGGYVIRWLLRLLESPLVFGGIVAIIAIAVSGRGQRVGDVAAGTTVVKLNATVALHEVVYGNLPDNYQVRFPEVKNLSDRDIQIIRGVVQRGNAEVAERTARKVQQVLSLETDLEDRVFLQTLLNDYQHIAMN
ncbi:RDD family protein [Tellurirhabdus bombi]|uniref:RDD family protein n=1 Tax=Tellurirhabdus bombi TaxID=2907205 RepID=UPI001F20B810|nr:RDD family protein [Tellurirhabdus bombi]